MGLSIISAGPVESSGNKAGTDEESQTGEESAAQNSMNDNIALVGSALLFLIRAGVIFLLLRLVWLVVQYGSRYLLQLFMSEIKGFDPAGKGAESALAVQALDARIRRSVASYVLHPFLRFKLTLSGFHANVSPESVLEKERRAVEADWRIMYGSWGPYRCLVWILPILGLAQTVLLLVSQLSGLGPASQKAALSAVKPLMDSSIQKQILETAKPVLSLLLPLIQAVGVAFFLQIGSTILRSFEELYLSSLDALIYDRLLSRLPVKGGGDAAVIVEALHRQFREFGAALARLEKAARSRWEVDRLP